MSTTAARNTLRIRDKATTKELNLPEDKLHRIEEIKSSLMSAHRKKELIKEIIGSSMCALCNDVPSIQLRYPIIGGGGTVVENYCSKCINSVYERANSEPKDKQKLADFYNVQIAEDWRKVPTTIEEEQGR